MIEKLKIGLIVKPQGIRGEVKVQPLTDDINRFRNLKEVIIDDKNYRVLSSTIGGGVVFLTINGINDRNTAETFRGKFLLVDRENAVPLEENRFFIADIIGCEIVTENQVKIGVVKDIFSARTDIFTIECVDGRIMRFPYLNKVVKKVDILNQIIVVEEQRLKEVACYEN